MDMTSGDTSTAGEAVLTRRTLNLDSDSDSENSESDRMDEVEPHAGDGADQAPAARLKWLEEQLADHLTGPDDPLPESENQYLILELITLYEDALASERHMGHDNGDTGTLHRLRKARELLLRVREPSEVMLLQWIRDEIRGIGSEDKMPRTELLELCRRAAMEQFPASVELWMAYLDAAVRLGAIKDAWRDAMSLRCVARANVTDGAQLWTRMRTVASKQQWSGTEKALDKLQATLPLMDNEKLNVSEAKQTLQWRRRMLEFVNRITDATVAHREGMAAVTAAALVKANANPDRNPSSVKEDTANGETVQVNEKEPARTKSATLQLLAARHEAERLQDTVVDAWMEFGEKASLECVTGAGLEIAEDGIVDVPESSGNAASLLFALSVWENAVAAMPHSYALWNAYAEFLDAIPIITRRVNLCIPVLLWHDTNSYDDDFAQKRDGELALAELAVSSLQRGLRHITKNTAHMKERRKEGRKEGKKEGRKEERNLRNGCY